MIDPTRKEVKAAIKECKQAGIKTVMITGDHVKTAEAIAKDLEMLPANGLVIEGRHMNQTSLQELASIIAGVQICHNILQSPTSALEPSTTSHTPTLRT